MQIGNYRVVTTFRGERCGDSRFLVVGVAEKLGIIELVLLGKPGLDGRRETDNDRVLWAQPGDTGRGTLVDIGT